MNTHAAYMFIEGIPRRVAGGSEEFCTQSLAARLDRYKQEYPNLELPDSFVRELTENELR